VPDIALYQYLVNHAEVEPALCNFFKLKLIVSNTTSPAAERVGHSNYDRIAELISSFVCVSKRVDCKALKDRNITFYHRVLKLLAVLSNLDTMNLRSKYTYAVLLEDPLAVQRDSAIERSLTSKT